MAVLTPLTIIFELIPPLIVSLAYLIFFRTGRNKFVEAFVILMYVKMISFFLFALFYIPAPDPTGFDAVLDSGTLFSVFFTDFLFQFGVTLQEFLTWMMISFFAVLFGMVVLGIKLALQDPLKMRFKNVIRSITKKEPESDGYLSLRHRIDNIEFTGIDMNPLDEVGVRQRRGAWKDYLIIGLVTILPSIPVYLDATGYYAGVLVFLTWIYRFGYPASNRIAKGAGLKLGDRDLGGEMMQGVLGWFFRFNLIISLGTLAIDIFNYASAGTLNLLIGRYTLGLWFAAWPIVFAILLLPLTEDFAVVLYKRMFDSIYKFRAKVSEFSMSRTLKNLAGSSLTAIIVIGAFIGAVIGVTLNYAWTTATNISFFPGQVDQSVYLTMIDPSSNFITITPTIWSLLMLLIPFGSMILIGVLGHLIRTKTEGGIEGFAFIAGVLVSVIPWFLLPGMDYLLGVIPTPGVVDGALFYRLRPIMAVPGAEEYLLRLAYQYIVNMPIYIFTGLFVMYYLDFRRKAAVEVGKESRPTFNVEWVDVKHSIYLFFGGLFVSFVGILLIGFVIDPSALVNLVYYVLGEIGNPNGLELVFAESTSLFLLLTEHNIYRTFLVLFIGPIFWSAALWLVAVYKSSDEKTIGRFSTIVVFLTAIMVFILTSFDAMRNPSAFTGVWNFTAQLGLRAVLLYGILIGCYLLFGLVNRSRGEGFGAWWYPLVITVIAMEYFIFDDQFTLIALLVFPMIMAGVSKLFLNRGEDFLLAYIRFSLMSIAITEVLSTALVLGGLASVIVIAPWATQFGIFGGLAGFMANTLPHAIIEIPAFLLAAAISIRIARNLGPDVQNENWESIPSKTRTLLLDDRTWRAFALITFFFVIGALIETAITPIIWFLFGGPPPFHLVP